MKLVLILMGVIYMQAGIAGTSSLDAEDSTHPQSCIDHVTGLRDYLTTIAKPNLYSDGVFEPVEREAISAELEAREAAYDSCLYSKTPREDAIDYYQLSAQLGVFVDMLNLPEEQMVPTILKLMDERYRLLDSLTGSIVSSSDN